jgi:hypothetical protein
MRELLIQKRHILTWATLQFLLMIRNHHFPFVISHLSFIHWE